MDLIADRIPSMKCGACGAQIDTRKVKPLSIVRCPACDAEASVPASFGDLFLIKLLGAGSAGIVCLGLNDKLHRQVAIKILKKAEGKDNEAHVKELLREARLLARLNHPNVVQVYSIGEHEGQAYIEMELVTGGQLDRMILEGQSLDEVHALKIAIGVAEGLQAAQGVGLIHRDVKPGNILLDPRGTPKLLDFGTAGTGADAGAVVGTPYYVAPEVIRKQPVDFRADIYSLGASLFHMIALRPPFEGANSREVIAARLKHRAPSLLEVVEHVEPTTAEVVARMLEPDPANRYASYTDLVADLKQALAAAQDAADHRDALSMASAPVVHAESGWPADSYAQVEPADDEQQVAYQPQYAPPPPPAPRYSAGAEKFRPKETVDVKFALLLGGISLAVVICLGVAIWWFTRTPVQPIGPDQPGAIDPSTQQDDGATTAKPATPSKLQWRSPDQSSDATPPATTPATAATDTKTPVAEATPKPPTVPAPATPTPPTTPPATTTPEPKATEPPKTEPPATTSKPPATTPPPTPAPTTPPATPAPTKPETVAPVAPKPVDSAPTTPAPPATPKPAPADTPKPATPAPPPATPKPATPAPVTPPFKLFVNVGGEAHTDAQGQGTAWVASQPYDAAKGTPRFGHVGGQPYHTDRLTDAVLSTYLYQIEGYRIDVPNGRYRVTLLFAEPADLGKGDRTFTARIEGQPVGSAIDAAGEAGADKAARREAVVDVTDGRIDITFDSDLNVQFLSGLSVTDVNE